MSDNSTRVDSTLREAMEIFTQHEMDDIMSRVNCELSVAKADYGEKMDDYTLSWYRENSMRRVFHEIANPNSDESRLNEGLIKRMNLITKRPPPIMPIHLNSTGLKQCKNLLTLDMDDITPMETVTTTIRRLLRDPTLWRERIMKRDLARYKHGHEIDIISWNEEILTLFARSCRGSREQKSSPKHKVKKVSLVEIEIPQGDMPDDVYTHYEERVKKYKRVDIASMNTFIQFECKIGYGFTATEDLYRYYKEFCDAILGISDKDCVSKHVFCTNLRKFGMEDIPGSVRGWACTYKSIR